MTNLLPHPEVRESNSSVVLDFYLIWRRQPWRAMASRTWRAINRTWNATKRFSLGALLTVLLFLMPQIAHARTYQAFDTNVPFKFSIGNRTFQPGSYQFILVGPGLLALRDEKGHIVASLMTRSVETGNPAPASKVIFLTQKKPAKLLQICIQNRSHVLEVVGEEATTHQAPPSALPLDVNSLFERRASPGMKH